MTKSNVFLFLVAAISFTLVGEYADAIKCTGEARPCSFSMGAWDCCVTVSSIPDLTPPDGETAPDFVSMGTNCGVKGTRLLLFPCWRMLSTQFCGTAATPICD